MTSPPPTLTRCSTILFALSERASVFLLTEASVLPPHVKYDTNIHTEAEPHLALGPGATDTRVNGKRHLVCQANEQRELEPKRWDGGVIPPRPRMRHTDT